MCSVPVWSITLTAIFMPGSGSSKGTVVALCICAQRWASIRPRNADCRLRSVRWLRLTGRTLIRRARKGFPVVGGVGH